MKAIYKRELSSYFNSIALCTVGGALPDYRAVSRVCEMQTDTQPATKRAFF